MRGREPRVAFLTGLVVFGAMGAFRWPPVDNLLRALPVLDVTDNRRLTLWVAFGLTLLGGIGLDHLGQSRLLAARLARCVGRRRARSWAHWPAPSHPSSDSSASGPKPTIARPRSKTPGADRRRLSRTRRPPGAPGRRLSPSVPCSRGGRAGAAGRARGVRAPDRGAVPRGFNPL